MDEPSSTPRRTTTTRPTSSSFHLDVLARAFQSLHAFIAQRQRELSDVLRRIVPSMEIDHRQVALLRHALRHPNERYRIEAHRRHHGVAYQTAHSDLLELDRRRLLEKTKMGRSFVFLVPTDLELRREPPP
jgi:Fic family protein